MSGAACQEYSAVSLLTVTVGWAVFRREIPLDDRISEGRIGLVAGAEAITQGSAGSNNRASVEVGQHLVLTVPVWTVAPSYRCLAFDSREHPRLMVQPVCGEVLMSEQLEDTNDALEVEDDYDGDLGDGAKKKGEDENGIYIKYTA